MRAGQQFAGDPVNVATGAVYSVYRDAVIWGRFPLEWERRYHTGLLELPPGPLGPGWWVAYYATLTRTDTGFRFVGPDGAEEVFADPGRSVDRGGVIRNLGTFQELARRGDQFVVTLWEVETGHVERYVFAEGRAGESWPLAAVEDVEGQGLDMVRGPGGRLTGVRQRLERRLLAVEPDRTGRVARLTLVTLNHRTTLAAYEYDRLGRLAEVTDAVGGVDRFEYDPAGRITREVMKDGAVFNLRYDAAGRCVRTAGLDGYDEKVFRYHTNIQFTDVTDSHGAVTRYHWLASGQVAEEYDPAGGCRRTEYDLFGRIVARTNPLGGVTRYGYDPAGNVNSVTDPLGNESAFAFNAAHLLVARVDPTGHTWSREYDAADRLVAEVGPDGDRWSVAYDPRGLPVRLTNPAGARRELTYSEDGVLATEGDWEGNVTRYVFDDFGRPAARTDPLGGTYQHRYNPLGHLIAITFPDGTRKHWEYNPVGVVTAVIDPVGHVTRYRVGPCRRLLTRTDPLGQTMKFYWGPEAGELLRVVNENGEEYSFERDALGRVVRERGFDGRELRAEYDLAGHLVAVVTGAGRRTVITRDIVGRITGQTFPDGTARTFEYNPEGFIAAAEGPDGAVRFDRDPSGRVVRESIGGTTVESRFDPAGNRIGVRSSVGGEIRFAHDQNGRVREVRPPVGDAVTIARDAEGREVVRAAAAASLRQVFDRLGRLSAQQVSPTGQGDVGRRYEYGRNGCLARVVQTDGRTTGMEYDPVERVTRVTGGPDGDEDYSYDPCTNLTRIRAGGTADDLEYGPGGRLLRAGETTFEYDDEGNTVRTLQGRGDQAREWRYTWTGANELRSVVGPDGTVWRYEYDPFGRRIATHGPDGTTRYVWDQDVVLHEVRGEGVQTWAFDPHGFGVFCRFVGGQTDVVVPDQLGTPRELVRGDGRVVWAADHLLWGTAGTSGPGPECPVRFPGQWADPGTGLHYNRWRYYDPATGRYLSPDPLGIDGGFNPYLYVPNPLHWIDPFGLQHGNSIGSTNPQHVYEIFDTHTNEPYKYGISGQPLNQNGTSPRANTQLTALNAGTPGRFVARIVVSGLPSRNAALGVEQHLVNSGRGRGLALPGNTRPQPNNMYGPCAR